MTGNIFVDTNIFVYSRDKSEPEKQARALYILRDLWNFGTGRVSTQVLNEYYVTVTQKLTPGLNAIDAWQDIEDLLAWQPLPVDSKVLTKARICQLEYGLSWWDSLIVAAAFFCDCTAIFTEDLNHGQSYLGIPVENPFTSVLDH